MYNVFDNANGGKIITLNSDSELIKFVKKLVKENGTTDFSVLGVSDAKEYLEYCPDLTLLEDSLGGTINIGDTVLVPEPNNSDLHQHSFVGNVEKFRNGNVVVIDGEGDCFEIEAHRLEIQDN